MVVLLGLRCLRRAYMTVSGLLKVAGFRAPIGGWFCAPADTVESVFDLEMVQVRVGPTHRYLNTLVELVEGAISHLYSPPDWRLDVLERDLELIDSFPGWDHADSLEVLDGSLGNVEDVSQGGSFHA